MAPLLLTPKETARALGPSQSYIYEILASETLPSITIGRTRRIPRCALEAFIEARAVEQSGCAPHAAVPSHAEEAAS